MQKKHAFIGGLFAVLLGCVAAYFVAPIVVRNAIGNAIQKNNGSSVKEIDISWSGPQYINGIHAALENGSADIDVVIENSLISMLRKNTPMRVGIQGDAVIEIQNWITPPKAEARHKNSSLEIRPKSSNFPAIQIHLQLKSVTIQSDESMQLSNVNGSLDVAPGHHFNATLSATTDLNGTVTASCNAPNLINDDGEIDWNSSGSLTLDITNAAIPTINGVGGWSITEMNGEISSPKFLDSLSIAINGKLAEYNNPRGSVHVKTQLVNPMRQGMFVLDNRNLMGSADLKNVPTSILAPIVSKFHIDTTRDIGPTANIHLKRIDQGSPLSISFESRDLQASANINEKYGVMENIKVAAKMHSEFLEAITGGEFFGEGNLTLKLNQLVPAGDSPNDEPECAGSVLVEGELHHSASLTTIQSIDAAISASVENREIASLGGVTIDGHRANFKLQLRNENKNKLNGLDGLFNTVAKTFPEGAGIIEIENLPSSLLHPFLSKSRIDIARDVGNDLDVTVSLKGKDIDFALKSEQIQVGGKVNLEGEKIAGFSDVIILGNINNELTSILTGTPVKEPMIVDARLKTFDLEGNSTFNATVTSGNQKTLCQGTTNRSGAGGLNLNLGATGIHTPLIDAMCNSGNMLTDSIGSPATLELFATDILRNPTIIAGGSTEKAAFEASVGFLNSDVFSIKETTSRADLILSTPLTTRVLKNLGPILSDIRSTKRPISISIQNANASIEGELSRLNADILIDIGEVSLDSGSLTMRLLPLFNSSHIKAVPAFFEPIHIEIQNGVVHYKEFRLIIDKKYAIPFSGTIDLITRKIDLKSAVPLTGLGHSIKELRKLETDIDVPLVTVGTIEEHVTMVDPKFDLSKVLESVAVEVIGDAIDDALETNKNSIDPIKLIEDLLGNE
ncbi:MAG: hypothetical protein VX436_02145 [Planctomycetota bacterium]|nr:hypothetical protein [Planctomycetota bacterium]